MLKKSKFPLMLSCGALALSSLAKPAFSFSVEDLQDTPEQPNVVVILADDIGYMDLGVYGSEISTPNIDRLAERGVKFSNYHTSASCAPSRAMLLTGVDNHLAGVPSLPETLPPEQAAVENYQGVLSDNVVTVASVLNAEGYHTYMAGKWHLGKETEKLPYNRGFERTIAMGDSGADNWEHRPYMPLYEDAFWTRDGEEIRLDDPFYSSELIVDEMIDFIESDIDDGQPFFSYLPFLAAHQPVQAPAEYTDLYLDTYEDGWQALREDRHDTAMEIGLVPEGSDLVTHEFIDDWDSLNEEEQQFEAKRMAVYAGMITAMDYHIGRFIEYLDETGELDNTIFIVTSDNGPEYNILTPGNIRMMGYTNEYDDLGEFGSYNDIGMNWASAAASPLSLFKFYAGEGGLRVPLIISGPGIEQQDGFQNAFTYVTDITPTILAMTGIEQPQGRFGGRPIEPITGKDLTPILDGSSDLIYQADDYIGYEVGGNLALFQDGYKLVLNREPYGDNEFYLFDIVNDPGETRDLKAQNPVQFQKMLNLYQRYEDDNGVLPVPDHYILGNEINQKGIRINAGENLTIVLFVGLTVGIFSLFGWQRKKYQR